MGRGRNGPARRDGVCRSGVVGDFERIGGGRHEPSYSNRGGGRLSLRLWTRVVRGGGARMARGLNGSANGAGHWPPPGDEGVIARTPGSGFEPAAGGLGGAAGRGRRQDDDPGDRRSAQTLGTEREGHGILVDDDGSGPHDRLPHHGSRHGHDHRHRRQRVAARIVGYDYESGFGLVRTEVPMPLKPMRVRRFRFPDAARRGLCRGPRAARRRRSRSRSPAGASSPATGSTCSTTPSSPCRPIRCGAARR